ncbi:MAG: hypothetical protein HYZ23_08310, partial [Chloroflexi bacterium]|nr:hypothetical protein [Chloroflexota bacterium]
MKRANNILFGVAALAIAALACSAMGGGGGNPTPMISIPTLAPLNPTAVIPASPVPTEGSQSNAGDVLFEDNFVPGRGEWGTGADAERTVDYVDDKLHFNIVTENYFVWTTPNDKDYSNVHFEATAFNNSSDSTSAFGIICHQQFIDESLYYFAITPSGDYAIVRAALAQNDTFLTNNGEWGNSDLIAKNAASYRIGADCANG